MAVRDQNINKARWSARREGCLVWKPTELTEECGIMKMAYLICEVCFSFISHLWPAPPFSCIGFVCQWVWGLWTPMGMLAPQLSVGSATPHLWREGAACEYHARTVSVTVTHTFCALEGASLSATGFVFICLCVTLYTAYSTSGNLTTTFTAQAYALPGNQTFFFFLSFKIKNVYYFKSVVVCWLKHFAVSVLQHGTMKHHSKCSLWRSFRMWWLASCPTSGNFGYLMLMEVFLVR